MPPTKRRRLQDARESLHLAKEQLGAAQIAWWEPANPAECVTNAFYAYENAVTAAMVAVGRKRSKVHPEKAKIAKQLYESNKLKTDVSDQLTSLNELRKDVQYGEPGFEMRSYDLEALVSELETFVDEVEQLLIDLEQG